MVNKEKLLNVNVVFKLAYTIIRQHLKTLRRMLKTMSAKINDFNMIFFVNYTRNLHSFENSVYSRNSPMGPVFENYILCSKPVCCLITRISRRFTRISRRFTSILELSLSFYFHFYNKN